MKTCVKLAASAVVTTMLMFASFPANAASPAESLEKGIYNEETTGNLDEAITHYRQVLPDAQKTEGLAAQAQYRLGRCLNKKGKKKGSGRSLQDADQEISGSERAGRQSSQDAARSA